MIEQEIFPFALIGASMVVPLANASANIYRRQNYRYCTVEFVHEGAGALHTNGQAFTPTAPCVYFLHKHSTHEYWPARENPWKKIFFVTDGPLMELLLHSHGLDAVQHIPTCPQLRPYFDEMLQASHGLDDEVHRRAAVIFHRFVAAASDIVRQVPAAAPIPESCLALKRYLNEHVQAKVSLQDYCRAHGCSTAHAIRQFKVHFATTPYDYLLRQRLAEAKFLLRHSAISIKEIAAQLQFSDPYHFSNAFRRATGQCPKAFRAQPATP